MNLEQLFYFLENNYNYLKKNPIFRKKIKILIHNYFFLLNWKLKKLKLGLVHFDIKQYFFGNIFLYDLIEMRYVRQDTTEEDELKIDRRLDALKWKWDFQNVGAFIIIFLFIWFIFKNYQEAFFHDVFYSFYEIEKYDVLSSYTLKTSFQNKMLRSLEYFQIFNENFVKILTHFSVYFKFF